MKRRGDDQKFVAKVLAIGTECDIALLTVEDSAFWEVCDSGPLGDWPPFCDQLQMNPDSSSTSTSICPSWMAICTAPCRTPLHWAI